MSSTPTLDAEYRKVINARYLDKPCTTCGGKLEVGDFAATNDFKVWDNICAKCAQSFAVQIAALVQRIEITAAPLGDNIPAFIVNDIAALEPQITKALAGEGGTQYAIQIKKNLRDVLVHVTNHATAGFGTRATPDPLIDALKAIAATNDFDSSFARSLVAGHAKYGSLTQAQRAAAERMIAKRSARAQQKTQQAPLPNVEPGLYRSDNGTSTVRRVYRTGKGRISCRRYDGTTFVYEGVPGLRIVAEGLDNGSIRLLNAVEASAFGKQIGRCFNCLSIGRPGHLSDDRSLAVGYGPDCADHNGWWYPTADEAARILRGDLDLDQKLTQSLTTGQPLVVDVDEDGNAAIAPALDDADVYIDDDEVEDTNNPELTACPDCGQETGHSNGHVVCDNCDWSDDEVLVYVPASGDPSTLVPATPEQIEAFAVFAPLSHEARDAIARSTVACTKPARDLKVGDLIAQNGRVAKLDLTTTPGVVYVWTESTGVGRIQADLIYNHGDPVRVIEVVNADAFTQAHVAPQDVTVAPAPAEAPTAPPAAPQAPVATTCVRCEEEPATVSFICHDGERFKVCPSCRSALVRYRVCPFHTDEVVEAVHTHTWGPSSAQPDHAWACTTCGQRMAGGSMSD